MIGEELDFTFRVMLEESESLNLLNILLQELDKLWREIDTLIE